MKKLERNQMVFGDSVIDKRTYKKNYQPHFMDIEGIDPPTGVYSPSDAARVNTLCRLDDKNPENDYGIFTMRVFEDGRVRLYCNNFPVLLPVVHDAIHEAGKTIKARAATPALINGN